MKLLQMPSPCSRVRLRASQEQNDFREEDSPWAIYRNHTVVLLRKYFRMSLEVGRMPSLLGGELFRAKVTAYKVHTFEDSVIFVHDMEQTLQRLDGLSQLLIARIYFEEFSHDEVAAEFRLTRRQVIRRTFETLDRTTAILIESGLLQRFCEEDGLPLKKKPRSVRRLVVEEAVEADS
jgi:hypothetical protein